MPCITDKLKGPLSWESAGIVAEGAQSLVPRNQALLKSVGAMEDQQGKTGSEYLPKEVFMETHQE